MIKIKYNKLYKMAIYKMNTNTTLTNHLINDDMTGISKEIAIMISDLNWIYILPLHGHKKFETETTIHENKVTMIVLFDDLPVLFITIYKINNSINVNIVEIDIPGSFTLGTFVEEIGCEPIISGITYSMGLHSKNHLWDFFMFFLKYRGEMTNIYSESDQESMFKIPTIIPLMCNYI